MKLKIRRVDRDIIYSDEEIDLTGLVSIMLVLDTGTIQIGNSNDELAIWSADGYLDVLPRGASNIVVRLI